ncbi:hypothetical protein [Yersinia ruckeri]|uniref:hypothetical protein n=1 Tax=Yersinia ruckeri TaxID=29486 RepID=UPI0022374355|nr:hypothetical protein [Yersinia ruckeri]MCW6598729.1 hypothetical protein [Yersinia ruckeri]
MTSNVSLDLTTKPGIRVGQDELDHLQTSLWDSILDFRKSVMSPGIISSTNPMDSLATSFKVSVSNNQIMVSPGLVFFEDGHIGRLDTPIYRDTPASASLLVVAPVIKTSGSQRTIFAEEHAPLITRELKVEYVDETQYATYSLNQIHEVLAYISADGISYTLSGNNLRRWSNIYDWNHRSKKGSGQVTESNPHGLTLFDMAFNSGLGVWSALGNDGVLVTGKQTEGNVPYSGSIMRVTINSAEWVKVSDTEYTYKPQFLPLNCLYMKDVATGNQVAFAYGMKSKVPTIKIFAAPPAQIELVMTVCGTLNFRVDKDNAHSLSSLESQNTEQVICQGAPLQPEKQPVINLASWANYPINGVKLYLTKDNQITTYPQEAQSALKLSSLSDEGMTVKISFSKASVVQMMLANNTAKADMKLAIKIVGKDDADKTIQDVINFDNTWAPIAGKNSAFTTLKFKSISQIQTVSGISVDISTTFKLFVNIPVDGFLIGSFDLTSKGIENYCDRRSIQIAPLGLASNNATHQFSDPYLADPYLSSGIAGGFLDADGVFVSRLMKFGSKIRIKLMAEYADSSFDAPEITWTPVTGNKVTSGIFVDIPANQLGSLTIKTPSKIKGFILDPVT